MDPSGSLIIEASIPSGLSGFDLYVQHWIPDPGGPVGFAASNGIKGELP